MNQKNIEEIERTLVAPKEWRHIGEADVRRRPKNSLLEVEEMDFEQGVPLVPLTSKQNDEIEKLVLQRLREGTFDNHIVGKRPAARCQETRVAGGNGAALQEATGMVSSRRSGLESDVVESTDKRRSGMGMQTADEESGKKLQNTQARDMFLSHSAYQTGSKAVAACNLKERSSVPVESVEELCDEIEGDLMKIVDFGNNGFVPDCGIGMCTPEIVCTRKRRNTTKSLEKMKNVIVLNANGKIVGKK